MDLIPTKKALPLFTCFKRSQIADCDNNTNQLFYSWHANYFIFNRKKILVFVNDLTLSPIVLADINAKNKNKLKDYIKLGIEEVFSYSDIPSGQVEKYFLEANEWNLVYKVDRSLIGINSDMIKLIQCVPEDIDFSRTLQPNIMRFLANTPYDNRFSEHCFSIDTTRDELNNL